MSNKNIDRRFNPSNYSISIQRFPDLKFEVQSVQLPDVSTGSALYPGQSSNIPMFSDSITYGTLVIDFILSENIETWKSIHDWLVSVRDAQKHIDYIDLQKTLTTDINIILYNNANNPFVQVSCYDCFPVSINFPKLDSSLTDSITVTESITFELSHFDILPPS